MVLFFKEISRKASDSQANNERIQGQRIACRLNTFAIKMQTKYVGPYVNAQESNENFCHLMKDQTPKYPKYSN